MPFDNRVSGGLAGIGDFPQYLNAFSQSELPAKHFFTTSALHEALR